MEIVTGYTGTAHITSAQDRAGNQGAYGTGSYILNVGSLLAPTIVSANEVRIADGVISHQGCIGIIESGTYDSLAITSGSQDTYRYDLIVARYEKDSSTNVESLSLVVIEGTETSGTPTDPDYNTGDIQEGDTPVDFPLFRVVIDGITISSVDQIPDNIMTQAESDAALTTLTTNMAGIFQRIDVTFTSVTVPANGQVLLGQSDTPSGYFPIGARVAWSSGSTQYVSPLGLQYQGGYNRIRAINVASSDYTVSGTIVFVFANTDYITT